MDAYIQNLINENADLRTQVETSKVLIETAMAFADTVEWDSSDATGHWFIRSNHDLAAALVDAVDAFRKANNLPEPE